MARKKKPFVIDDSTNNDLLFDPVVDGERKGRGYDPSFIDPELKAARKALPSEIKLIDPSEWDAQYEEQEAQKSSLYHLKMTTMADGKPHLSLDQNGEGYCWAYSTGAGMMYARAAMHLPYKRFSPHAVACKIKGFRDEGGWNGLSEDFGRKNGYPTEEKWPQKSMSRQYDNAETWAEAANYKITADFADLNVAVYDRNMTNQQIATCLFNNIPVMVDYDEWGHSIVAIQWVRLERGVWVPRIDNSWTPGWGENGTGLINRRWNIDGATAVILVGKQLAA
jgi:hypothetical protein